MNVDSGYAEVNGGKLYYEVAGEGEPLVLVHGFTLDTRMWNDQFAEFSKHYKVIRYDIRGFGKSSNPVEGKQYSNHIDLKTLLDNLRIDKANILGLSMGGAIAISFTLEYPEYVKSLIPIDSSLDGFNYSKNFLEYIISIFTIAKEKNLDDALDFFINGPLFEATMRNPVVANRMRHLVGSYNGWRLLHNDPQREPVPSPNSRLDEIKCPIFTVVGEYDIPDFHRIADKISNEAPNARKLVIKGVGHMSNLEDPETFNKEILSFLSSL